MIFTSIYINCFLCLLLLNFQWKENKSVIYLCLLLIIFNVRQTAGLLLNSQSNNIILTRLLYVMDPIAVMCGPMILYFFKSIVHKKFYMDYLFILMCIIPSTIILMNLWPYFQLTFSEKQNIILSTINHTYKRDFPMQHTLFFSFKIQVRMIATYNLAFMVYSFYYIFKANKALKIKANVDRYIKSIISIMLITVVPVLLFVLITSYITNEKFEISLKVSKNINSDFLYLLTLIPPISFLFFPQLIYGQNQSKSIYLKIKEILNSNFKGMYQEVPVEFEKSTDIDRIITYIDKQKPYINPTFSLHSISSELNIPYLQVSNCLNKEMKVSFPEFRNQKRVEYAIQLFKEKKHHQMSIEGISDLCGFKSKSSFYLAFRAVYQVTPTEWIAKNL